MSRLVSWLLNIAYLAALTALAPVIGWQAWRTGKYREGYAQKLLGRVPVREGQGDCIWLHAVSVGEVNLLATLIKELECEPGRPRPGRANLPPTIIVSTTTKTGYDLAKRKYGSRHMVFYCPLDFTWAVRTAMRRIRPTMLVLAELEFWPNLITEAKDHGAKVAIVNGRLSDNSFRGYSRIGWLVRRVMRKIDLVAAQDVATAERFVALGATNVVVTGSLKYDGATTDRANAKTLELGRLIGASGSGTSGLSIWLCGSTQAPEEELCLEIFERVRHDFPDLRLILVPRHPERFDEVAAMLDQSGIDWIRRTQLDQTKIQNPKSTILVDAVGELGAWWGLADIGFVGGSFGDRGGQNMIEPAAYGVATCFGPNTKNFRDIVAALTAADGARVVEDPVALEAFVRRCVNETDFAKRLGDDGQQFVKSQLGATQRTVELLNALTPVDSSPSPSGAGARGVGQPRSNEILRDAG